MKKFLGLATGLLLTVFTMAHHGVTFDDASAEYDKASTNTFNFTMSDDFSIEDINKTAAYYVDYFSVSTSAVEGGNNVIFTVNDDNDMARRVITRFFVSLEVKEIDVNGEHVELNEFITNYIMK
ncbi:MAG: hypothetical protein BM555_05935 [Crocinitomix sp. MedPE-SWsnd]|jgi:hypothetical protein|nr:MAG: hypothetical protein BM555_05935 [Crocinitomix sp. MedPE-SWsnd]